MAVPTSLNRIPETLTSELPTTSIAMSAPVTEPPSILMLLLFSMRIPAYIAPPLAVTYQSECTPLLTRWQTVGYNVIGRHLAGVTNLVYFQLKICQWIYTTVKSEVPPYGCFVLDVQEPYLFRHNHRVIQ